MMTRRREALSALMKMSSLRDDVHAQKCIDTDRGTVNVDALDDYDWLPDQAVLVDLIYAVWEGSDTCDVSRFINLSEYDRLAVLHVLRVWLTNDETP
jgi:hypothetical protein